MKLHRTLGLMSALAVLGGTVVMAQEPKTPKAAPKPADDKKPAPKAAAKTEGKFEIFLAKNDKWRYRIKNADDKTIAMPAVGWEKKEDCLKALEDIKSILANVKPVEVKE